MAHSYKTGVHSVFPTANHIPLEISQGNNGGYSLIAKLIFFFLVILTLTIKTRDKGQYKVRRILILHTLTAQAVLQISLLIISQNGLRMITLRIGLFVR